MEAYIKGVEMGRKHQFIRAPKFKPLFRLAGLSMMLYAGKIVHTAYRDIEEMEPRFTRLSEDVHRLKGRETVSPPWVGNYDKWWYRLVEVEGRLIHRDAFFVPSWHRNYEGFQYIVPMVTEEDENLENRKGLLVNMGWYPHEFKHFTNRPIANSTTKVRVVGVVTRGELHDTKRFFKGGNAYDEQRRITGNFDLKAMAKATGFDNEKECGSAVIERVDLRGAGQDMRLQPTYARDLSDTTEPPFPRTLSGFVLPQESSTERNVKVLLLSLAGAALMLL